MAVTVRDAVSVTPPRVNWSLQITEGDRMRQRQSGRFRDVGLIVGSDGRIRAPSAGHDGRMAKNAIRRTGRPGDSCR